MNTKDQREYKRRYQRFHHHAWAGSIMLSLLLAFRIFLEISDVAVDDRIFLPVGIVLLVYTLIALFYTYRYREGLEAEDAASEDVERERIAAETTQRQAELEAEIRQMEAKELAKARKKEAKALAKAKKKAAKEAAKARKKAEKEAEKKEKKDDS